jgi:imidazolonepropionase-like amidohydrolase
MSIAARASQPPAPPVLLEGCAIIDCAEADSIVTDGALLIEEGRIRAAGPRSAVLSDNDLAGARRVDCSGSYVMPGLWDCHAHLGGVVPPHEGEYAHESAAHHMIRCIRKAQDNLRSGVTSVRSLGEQNDGDVVLRNAIEAGEIEGPRVFAAGDMMWSRNATGAEEFQRQVRRMILKDVDHIKLLSSGGIPWRSDTIGHTLHSYDEISAAVREAHSWNKPVAVHGMGDETIVAAAQAGADTVEHGFVVTEKGLAAMAEAGTMFCPNLAVTVAWDPAELAAIGYPEWFVDNAREAGAHHHEMFTEAVRLGVPILAGVDNLPEGRSPVGIEMHDGAIGLLTELKLIARLGLGNGGALLKRGKIADLIVLNANPLDDLDALAGLRSVWKGGREIRLVPGLEPGWQGGGIR